jgi:hypothetical protein
MKEIVATMREIGGTATWKEKTAVENDVSGSEFYHSLIEKFNATLYPGEKAREVLDVVEVIDPRTYNMREHKWRKKSLVTQSKGGVLFDEYECENCGIIGRRYGLDHRIVRDPKYRDVKYNLCPGKVPDQPAALAVSCWKCGAKSLRPKRGNLQCSKCGLLMNKYGARVRLTRIVSSGR